MVECQASSGRRQSGRVIVPRAYHGRPSTSGRRPRSRFDRGQTPVNTSARPRRPPAVASRAMDEEVRLKRARSFGSVAGEYERARPGYPVDAVRWLVGDTPCRVVDLGAGTGKLTRGLVALGHDVTAVEPSEEML